MPAIEGNNLGLFSGWVRGEDFWGGPMNQNLTILDSVVFLIVQSASFSAPPPDAEDGQVYIVAANPTGPWLGQEGAVAVLIGETWTFLIPKEGWRARFKSIDAFMWYNGTSWIGELDGFDPDNPGSGDGGPAFFDLMITVPDDMLDDEPIIHVPLSTALLLPGNMSGSTLDMINAMPQTAGLRVYRNGLQIGTITITEGNFNATFTTSAGGAVLFAAGDRLTVRGPAIAVAGFKQFGFFIRFNVVQIGG